MVDVTPEWLKSFAIRTFGTADKLVLLGGIAVVLAFAAYPGFVLAGWFFVRRAERNEATFTSLVHPEEEG